MRSTKAIQGHSSIQWVDFVLTSGHLLLGDSPARVLVKQYSGVTETISVGSAITGEQSGSANRLRSASIGINPCGLENAGTLQCFVGQDRTGGLLPEYRSQRQRRSSRDLVGADLDHLGGRYLVVAEVLRWAAVNAQARRAAAGCEIRRGVRAAQKRAWRRCAGVIGVDFTRGQSARGIDLEGSSAGESTSAHVDSSRSEGQTTPRERGNRLYLNGAGTIRMRVGRITLNQPATAGAVDSHRENESRTLGRVEGHGTQAVRRDRVGPSKRHIGLRRATGAIRVEQAIADPPAAVGRKSAGNKDRS